MSRLLVVLLIHGYLARVSYSACASIPEGGLRCVCVTQQGTIDLSAIANSDGSPRFKGVIDNQGYSYSYNPCYKFTESGCTDTAACQVSDAPRSIGLTTSETFINENNRYYLEYSFGTDGRSCVVNLICDRSRDEPLLEALGEPYPGALNYEFNLRSKCACLDGCGPSDREDITGGVGIAAIVLSMAGLATYFVVGAIILKFKYQRTGIDIIPNLEFWKALPFLIKDGLVFTFSPLFNCARGSGDETATLKGLKE